MQGPDRPIPIRAGRLTHWPEGYCPQYLQRQVRYFTRARVPLDANFTIGSLDEGNPDQGRLEKKPTSWQNFRMNLCTTRTVTSPTAAEAATIQMNIEENQSLWVGTTDFAD